MCDKKSAVSVRKHHSCYTNVSSEKPNSHAICKSDANIGYISRTESSSYKDKSSESNQEYYKKYEHDEIPVKDDSSFNDHSFSEDNDLRSGDNKDSLTNSDLDKLEIKILSKISQKLQTDDDVSCLESNIKLFKTTVQEIFDNFYDNMHDFELYKQKFYNIIEKNKGDSFSEMEVFIKDVIQNIGSSRSIIFDEKVTQVPLSNYEMIEKENKEYKNYANNVEPNVTKIQKTIDHKNSTKDTFLNDNYLTDSTIEDCSSKCNPDVKKEDPDYYNNNVLRMNPYVENKMANRDMLSVINIKENNIHAESQMASAENIQKLAAKKLQIENYVKLKQDSRSKERNIPVKIATVKKNIHLDEDFTDEVQEEETEFFIFKICNYICKKFRRHSIV